MLIGSMLFLLILLSIGGGVLWFKQRQRPNFGRRKQPPQEHSPNTFPHHPPKPDWVKQEIIRLKSFMPSNGHRKIAQIFNRLYAEKRNMTVGKTYVGYTIKNNLYEIQVLRKKWKHKRPKPVPHNLVWAMDLTGKTDQTGNQHTLLGIVEHQSRACLKLEALQTKASIVLLRTLLDTMQALGNSKPNIIRTDNETVFTSRLFRLGLWLLRIKHQRTEVACPWMNGRIERFFGTLKEKLNQWHVDSFDQLNHSLHVFRFWYNHVRPHQYLDGLTPVEVWQGRTGFKWSNNKAYWFNEWDGLLTGYYLPP